MSSKKKHIAKPKIASQECDKGSVNDNEAKKSLSSAFLNINGAVIAAFILLCYWLLVMKNGYMLRWYDEMSFFDSGRFFLKESLQYPGGLFNYAGTWLTQLMYYPFLGATVLIVLWLAIAWLTVVALRLEPVARPLASAVPMCMLVSVLKLDEAWLSMNCTGYLYSNTLGYLFAIASVCLYRLTGKRQAVGFLVALITASCYFFAGFYAILGDALIIIVMTADIIRNKKYRWIVYPLLTAAFTIAVPYLHYLYFNDSSVDNEYLYLKGLPDLMMEDFDTYLWSPFVVATVMIVIMAVLSSARLLQAQGIKYVGVGATCIMAIWCVVAEQKNEQLRATVQMLRLLEKNDWRGMTDVMSAMDESPNLTIRILNNMAVINLGGRSANMENMQPLPSDPRHAEWFTMTAFINVPVNYYEGLFNESYRWAMEHNVQYGKRVFFLKYMVKDALLNGDVNLARRYNELLRGTMFHRRWAEYMQQFIDNPDLIEKHPEFRSILPLSRRHKKNL